MFCANTSKCGLTGDVFSTALMDGSLAAAQLVSSLIVSQSCDSTVPLFFLGLHLLHQISNHLQNIYYLSPEVSAPHPHPLAPVKPTRTVRKRWVNVRVCFLRLIPSCDGLITAPLWHKTPTATRAGEVFYGRYLVSNRPWWPKREQHQGILSVDEKALWSR